MEHDAPIPKKNRKKLNKNCKSERGEADPSGMGNTYGIDHLTIFQATHSLDDSECLLAQSRIGQMENKINNDKSLTCEYNKLSNILNTIKHGISKNR